MMFRSVSVVLGLAWGLVGAVPAFATRYVPPVSPIAAVGGSGTTDRLGEGTGSFPGTRRFVLFSRQDRAMLGVLVALDEGTRAKVLGGRRFRLVSGTPVDEGSVGASSLEVSRYGVTVSGTLEVYEGGGGGGGAAPSALRGPRR